MANINKSTAKPIQPSKELRPSDSNSGDNTPTAAAEVQTERKKMQKKGSSKQKYALKSSESGKESPKKDKQKKIKMVRDSFTMPENDYANIAALKKKCLAAGVHVKKSELLRAGLTHLTKLSNPDLLKTVNQVERIKTGRPAKRR